MSELVNPEDIERIVGALRHTVQHLGRAVSAEQTVYVLHSHECRGRETDLRACPYSVALDRGIDLDGWRGFEDRAVVVAIIKGRLFPLVPGWLDVPTTPGERTS